MQTQGLLYQLPAWEHNSLLLYGSLFFIVFFNDYREVSYCGK